MLMRGLLGVEFDLATAVVVGVFVCYFYFFPFLFFLIFITKPVHWSSVIRNRSG